MDTGRTTLIMIAATTGIMVAAARIGQRRRRPPAVALADLIGCHKCWSGPGLRELRRGQIEMNDRLGRLEEMTAQLLEIGDEVVSTSRVQMQAVAGAYEAAGDIAVRREGRVTQLRRVSLHEP